MKKSRQRLGSWGEQIARGYLRRKGFRILESNYHTRWGEVDIIAQQGETLVFVEVKTARACSYGPPRCWVDGRKRMRLIRAASQYLNRRQSEEASCRFDVITVELVGPVPKLTHIVNAFSA